MAATIRRNATEGRRSVQYKEAFRTIHEASHQNGSMCVVTWLVFVTKISIEYMHGPQMYIGDAGQRLLSPSQRMNVPTRPLVYNVSNCPQTEGSSASVPAMQKGQSPLYQKRDTSCQHSTSDSVPVRRKRNMAARCCRAMAAVVTSCAFWVVHQKCLGAREAAATLQRRRARQWNRHQKVFDVDVISANRVSMHRQGVDGRNSTTAFQNMKMNMDWCVLGAGAAVCALV